VTRRCAASSKVSASFCAFFRSVSLVLRCIREPPTCVKHANQYFECCFLRSDATLPMLLTFGSLFLAPVTTRLATSDHLRRCARKSVTWEEASSSGQRCAQGFDSPRLQSRKLSGLPPGCCTAFTSWHSRDV
jgi:hypothetical protein